MCGLLNHTGVTLLFHYHDTCKSGSGELIQANDEEH